MTLDELKIVNFGVYAGRQAITLTPASKTEPVILVGGLNGAGKSTLLDAIQVAMYGRLAPCVSSGAKSYNTYLRNAIHRGKDPAEGASVELAFRNVTEGVDSEIRLRRIWHCTGDSVRERLEVERDGVFDAFLSDHWLESVDQYLPLGVVQLVFFDGERVEALADPSGSSEALRAAMHGLLGLDIVDQLVTDLGIYIRRKRAAGASPELQNQIESAESELRNSEESKRRLVAKAAELQNTVDIATKTLNECDREFAKQGGPLIERRADLEDRYEKLCGELSGAEDVLRELASATAPLLIVADLISASAKQSEDEHFTKDADKTQHLLELRDKQILQQLEASTEVDATMLHQIRAVFANDRKSRSPATRTDIALDLPRAIQDHLKRTFESTLPEARCVLSQAHDRVAALRIDCARAEQEIGSIPHQDSVAELVQARAQALERVRLAESDLQAIRDELERVRRKVKVQTREHERLLESNAMTLLRNADDRRSIKHAERVSHTVRDFRVSLLARNSARIASLVLDSLQVLLRKQRLIDDLKIDTGSFSLALRTVGGTNLDPHQLSAGERQLLAVALLWGLAKASARPLPVVIDTPLGRLDSLHRQHLIERYFPVASHQVVLLSTDEEVTPALWQKLRPYVGRSYTLVHDDATNSSAIREGYFQ